MWTCFCSQCRRVGCTGGFLFSCYIDLRTIMREIAPFAAIRAVRELFTRAGYIVCVWRRGANHDTPCAVRRTKPWPVSRSRCVALVFVQSAPFDATLKIYEAGQNIASGTPAKRTHTLDPETTWRSQLPMHTHRYRRAPRRMKFF